MELVLGAVELVQKALTDDSFEMQLAVDWLADRSLTQAVADLAVADLD
jgi:hypothetical protein